MDKKEEIKVSIDEKNGIQETIGKDAAKIIMERLGIAWTEDMDLRL